MWKVELNSLNSQPSTFLKDALIKSILTAKHTNYTKFCFESFLTDEEYDALDEKMTRSVPAFEPEGSDWLVQRELRQLGLTKCSQDYLLTKAAANRKSPAQIIDEMVLEKITPQIA